MSYPKPLLEIITEASSYDLVTLAQIKAELNITNTDQDELLETRIHRASEAINNYCNRIFIQETVSETFRSGFNWNHLLFLKRTPIRYITSIVIGVSPNQETIEDTLYEFDENDSIGGFVYPLDSDGQRTLFPTWSSWGSWSCGSIMTVTYVGGYLLAEVPYTVQEACIELVKLRQASGGSVSDNNKVRVEIPGVWSKTTDTTSKDSNSFFPDLIKDMLAPFKKKAFPR
jgi:hypothetical protein